MATGCAGIVNANSQTNDHELAAHLASSAAAQLQQLREEMQESHTSFLNRQLAGDQLSHRFLTAALAQVRPQDKVLSEEGQDDLTRLGKERVWIVDPLDGSSDFGDLWSDTWAVHVGLSVNGHPKVGAVAIPAWGRTFSTPNPTTPNPTTQLTDARRQRPRVLMSRTRVLLDGHRLARQMDADIFALGSAGVKAMTVVAGEADAWVHGGNLYEWDSCAPAAVALAAGLHVSHLDGSPLVYNQQNLSQTGILICRPELAKDIQTAFANL